LNLLIIIFAHIIRLSAIIINYNIYLAPLRSTIVRSFDSFVEVVVVSTVVGVVVVSTVVGVVVTTIPNLFQVQQ